EEKAAPERMIAPERMPVIDRMITAPMRVAMLEPEPTETAAVRGPAVKERIEAIESIAAQLGGEDYTATQDGKYKAAHDTAYDGMVGPDKIDKTITKDTSVAIQASILEGRDDEEGGISGRAMEILTAFKEGATGEFKISILVMTDKDEAIAFAAAGILAKAGIEVEIVGGADESRRTVGRFMEEETIRLEAEEAERPSIERLVVMVRENSVGPVATNPFFRNELAKDDSKAALRILGDNLFEYDYEYGRLCSILAIPVDMPEYRVIYLMGQENNISRLRELLGGMGISVTAVEPDELRMVFKRHLEVERAM
ncbi:MAG: hypothetical protein HQ575_06780, partial [Candidatus Omnitrophica bacterium]|nr:hypothetical protein [Candidatus Omnitrophota bacterium]